TNHHPQCFSRAVVNHKIGTHARGAGPHDFLFDEFGNGEGYAEFFAYREALAGVSGRSPDQGICDAGACAVLQMHILSRNGHRETAKKTGRHARNSIKLD
ncbi:hypothetical protein OIK99_23190, partial [Salmonella enterica subsp. enterica serovar Agona]|nr:hypothetical protein [Salmonella enterica subsp. enterica serovar Agona]